jgi:integrase/recombinase XerD
MLHIYRRHLVGCGKRKRVSSCSCPIWVQGRLHGEKMRKSLGIRNWESAQKIVRDMEAKRTISVTVGDAWERFISDCKARGLSVETIYKYELLKREMTTRMGATLISDVSVDLLSQYRESWKLGGAAAQIRIALLRRFFRFCVDRGWAEKNPASSISLPKVVRRQVQPFSEEEIRKIMEGIEKFRDAPPGRRAQLRAFILALRYTGLRIRDVVTMDRGKIFGTELAVRTHKTGAMVRLPLHDDLRKALESLPDGKLFWSGNGTPKSAVAAWERTLSTLFDHAGIAGGTAHRFRHTMAVRLLMNGVSLDNVAAILGNSSRIVEKHYAAWIPARQEKLNEAVRATY